MQRLDHFAEPSFTVKLSGSILCCVFKAFNDTRDHFDPKLTSKHLTHESDDILRTESLKLFSEFLNILVSQFCVDFSELCTFLVLQLLHFIYDSTKLVLVSVQDMHNIF